MSRVLLLMILLFFKTESFADCYEDVTKQKSVPKSVNSFAERQLVCGHWLGEYPYDEDRRQEINKAVNELRCGQLAKDEVVLRKKYKHHRNILKYMNSAKDCTL